MLSQPVSVLFDDEVRVHYGFLYLQPEERLVVDMDFTRDQANGLVGAAHAGVLFGVTGLHTGDVPVRVEWHAAEPTLAGGWEDVVEVPFTPDDDDYELRTFEDGYPLGRLPLTAHRARWHATGMDAAREADVRAEGEPAVDRYLLQLWPAPPAPDVVVRVGSGAAAYWHAEAAEAR